MNQSPASPQDLPGRAMRPAVLGAGQGAGSRWSAVFLDSLFILICLAGLALLLGFLHAVSSGELLAH